MKVKTALRDIVASYRSNRARRFGLEAVATITLLAIAIIVSSNLNGMPDMQSIDDAPTRKATFFGYLAPIAETLNQDILQQRAKLLEIADRYQREQELSFLAGYQLKSMAQQYAVDWHESDPASVIASLKRRVDMVPVSLLLVQAAKESGWGTSRFAREGNNLFGQWCYSKGCGIVPDKRSSGAKHEVRVFDSVVTGGADFDSASGVFRYSATTVVDGGSSGIATMTVVGASYTLTDQGDPGFAGVVKMKVGSDLFPAAAFMAQRAVFGKGVVGNHWASAFVPLVRTRLFLSRGHHARGRQVASGKRKP